jgi:hypothetical protein
MMLQNTVSGANAHHVFLPVYPHGTASPAILTWVLNHCRSPG